VWCCVGCFGDGIQYVVRWNGEFDVMDVTTDDMNWASRVLDRGRWVRISDGTPKICLCGRT
jgi:hypothetical protein